MSADVKAMAAVERGELADFLETLAPEHWDVPSLCTGWTVRDVVTHMIGYDELGLLRTIGSLARSGFSLHRSNAKRVAEAEHTPAELIALLRKHQRPRGITAAFGGFIALVDGTVHHQDIRRALGKPREIPADRLRATLRLALRARPIHAAQRAKGLGLVASDVDWTHGDGPQVRGPGEALLMALAGRAEALAELTGPGVATLAGRV
ncbi:maleylpyruvate isomerase family mycothiol-dependent enzyme [Labedaea rhizosphaerae]|uniref:Uncharacterized protein (TIGR03083 family) n=1 Tax=Labedaea rhizosphaerae TaxID=598644 RepID=A0A4R6SIX1_LABRH|nr:maleylpyruvate isomerase family mycothiol-dependent enzyme [Labedaea rhizosphaerae]TDQ01336.1 uncharacterized protein (TIGR03083 family) [Labedaea rhizosphaerae]